MSSTSGRGSAMHQRSSAWRSACPGPTRSSRPGQMPSSDSSPSVTLAWSASSARSARMPSATFSRSAWTASTLTYTQR